MSSVSSLLRTRPRALATGAVSALVGIVDTGAFSKSRCKPVTAAGLKVFPPNARQAVTLKKKFSTCSSKASVSLEVRPVK